MSLSSTFVQTVRSQSWYSSVNQEMENAGVPEYLWIAILADEDQSLNPSVKVADRYISDGSFAGYSYGLFQINNQPQATDPAWAGQWAANKLGPAVAALPSGYTPQQALIASETAAWPGQAGTSEEPQRLALLNAVLAQEGGTNGITGNNSTPVSDDTTNSGADVSGIQSTINSAVASAQSFASGALTNVFIGGAILAVIGGGFALLASGD